jgi:hypothetical protein
LLTLKIASSPIKTGNSSTRMAVTLTDRMGLIGTLKDSRKKQQPGRNEILYP